MPALAHHLRFEGTHGSARWEGCAVGDAEVFRAFVRGPVSDRVRDAEAEDRFASELHGLATTGMATEFVERLLRATPEPLSWEVGEALAECVLEQDSSREVCWPWNSARDRRTPRASLPGADLVGFCRLNLYRSAVTSYVASRGRELLLVGILLRDTSPAERDVKSRAIFLADRLPAPTRIEIVAWYLPVPISQWPDLVRGDAP